MFIVKYFMFFGVGGRSRSVPGAARPKRGGAESAGLRRGSGGGIIEGKKLPPGEARRRGGKWEEEYESEAF